MFGISEGGLVWFPARAFYLRRIQFSKNVFWFPKKGFLVFEDRVVVSDEAFVDPEKKNRHPAMSQ